MNQEGLLRCHDMWSPLLAGLDVGVQQTFHNATNTKNGSRRIWLSSH